MFSQNDRVQATCALLIMVALGCEDAPAEKPMDAAAPSEVDAARPPPGAMPLDATSPEPDAALDATPPQVDAAATTTEVQIAVPKNSIAVLTLPRMGELAPTARLEIHRAPEHGSARVLPDGRLEYTTAWNRTEDDSFDYRWLDDTASLGTASVRIRVQDRRWAMLGAEPYSLQELEGPASEAEPPKSTVAWTCRSEPLFCSGTTADAEQNGGAFWRDAQSERVVYPGAAATRLHHHSASGVAAGAQLYANGLWRGATRSAAGDWSLRSSAGLDSEVWYGVNDADVLAGSVRGQQRFADVRQHAALLRGDVLELLDPPGSSEASAYAISDRGTVVGSYVSTQGERRAFRFEAGVFADLAVEGAASVEAFDVDAEGDVVGSFATEGEGTRGVLWRASEALALRAPDALSTALRGITRRGDQRMLAGTLQTPQGRERAFWAERMPLPTAVASLRPMTEPRHPDVAHACGHTDVGPFQVRMALPIGTPVSGSMPLDATHTSYSIALPASSAGHEGSVAIRAGKPTRITLYVFPDVPLLVRDAQGVPVVARAYQSQWCERIAWIHELELPAAGEYSAQFGPTAEGEVNAVLESGWVFE